MVERNIAAGRLFFDDRAGAGDPLGGRRSSSPSARPRGAATALPTSRYVYDAAREIAREMNGFTVVVTKSTVPVGTNDEVEAIIRKLRPGRRFCGGVEPGIPARGRGDRGLQATRTASWSAPMTSGRARVMGEVYRPLFINETPIMFTGRRTAELIKYASNAFLATKITFINEMADLCEQVGANVQEVARGMGLDRRIGSKFLHAGPGFGGSCFPKDTAALVAIGAASQLAGADRRYRDRA